MMAIGDTGASEQRYKEEEERQIYHVGAGQNLDE